MHMDENTCVELALDPRVCVLDDTGGWVDAPEVVSRDGLDRFPVTPELLIQLRSTVGSVQPGEDIALVFRAALSVNVSPLEMDSAILVLSPRTCSAQTNRSDDDAGSLWVFW